MEIFYLPQVTFFIESNIEDSEVKSIILKMIIHLEKWGHLLRSPDSKKIIKDIYELRIRSNV